MDSIHFEEITEETLYIVIEIINSNPEYIQLEHGKERRTLEEVKEDLLNGKTKSLFIKFDDTYIGIIDYLLLNEKDQCPWLGLLMIHADYQGFGFGRQAYFIFEKEMVEKGLRVLRIGVLKENHTAQRFWRSVGFEYFKTARSNHSNEVDCFEKKLKN
ncbi:GNAT family acetyltransferase [Neobacillus bataviensis LMG 21833]|uniref:GNAT family acetyltransferase n=1 Tax=Neobacillus bataviensis LMG 21833 TaxID=1117379 RepID=K6DCZ6_9BACI|nr:GNAT family N-acetyltransferase [Neobacillus bataviensis]EKN65943.1 GNAT family acetyltransferase [Neobacillus bataviensis LMG 21833]